MTLMQKLKEQGWHLTEEGLKKLTTELSTEDVQKIIAAAVNWDLKDIGGGALPAKPESNGYIAGRMVLQIQKMRNISAPKANEESAAAPRFLQLELSDGVNSIPALELERIPNLTLNVPPGTKLYFKSEKLQMMQGFLVLKESDVQILRGRVEHMVEKWELARQMLKYARTNRRLSGSGAPPPWIAFEKRLDTHKETLPHDRNFKSLQSAGDKDKNSKENDEFNATRSQAIAEAAKTGQKKVFGGGQQNILDHNVKKILEKGYTEDDAKYALKTTNNNLERALYNLKRRNNKGVNEGNTKPSATLVGGGQRGRGVASAKEEAVSFKPQATVSLFDFFTDKLPVTTSSSSNTTQSPAQSQPATNTQSSKNSRETKNPFNTNSNGSSNSKTLGRFENNMSSSFAAKRETTTTRPDEKIDKQTQPSNYSQSQRQNYNPRDERKTNISNKSSNRGGERSRVNNDKTTATVSNDSTTPPIGNNGNNNSNPVQSSTYNANANRRSEKAERPQRKETPRQSVSTGGYQSNKRNQDFKTNENKSYQQRDNNSRGSNDNKNSNSYQQTPPPTKSNNFDNALDKLAESTAKMGLQNKKESYNNSQGRGRHQGASSRSSNQNQNAPTVLKSNNSQQQTGQFISSQNFTNKSQVASQPMTVSTTTPQQQQQPSHAFVAQMPNGFSYDPSKIMGFQSKEANEYAMNLLKSQGLLPQQSPAAGAQQTQMQPPPQQHNQQQIINSAQAAPSAAVAYMPQNPNVFVAPQQPPMAQYGMMASGSWPWNIGDLCLAKYWEDGNYYDAKITGISENTCVVIFLGYGNHEEVLKSDCLPISDAQHHPLNVFQAAPPPTATMQQQALTHAYQGGSNASSAGGGGGNQRYRIERQMYVPPPKRGNQNNNN